MLRRALLALSTVALAGGLVVAGGVLGSPGGAQDPAASSSPAPPGSVEALQQRLERVPGDAAGWATLGLLYVDRARTTLDPSWYGRAQEAVDRSLEVQPQDNAAALTALASLRAAQHDFAEAERTAREAIAVNAFDDTAYGVLADALTELGRYDEAVEALQSMADVDPGFAALTRISYARELRGDRAGAVQAMEQAREAAVRPEDLGYALFHLGQLAWDAGDRATAERHWQDGLRAAPDSLELQGGLARAAAAAGRTEEALAAYERVTSRVPVQQHLVEHAELLASLGREQEAAAQLEVVRTSNRLLEAAGSVVDLETALFEADHGSPQVALATAQRVHAERPGVFTADALGWALHVNGRSAEALPLLDQALALGLRRASFLYHRGTVLAALGRDDEARADLTEALATDPWFSVRGAADARATLARLG